MNTSHPVLTYILSLFLVSGAQQGSSNLLCSYDSLRTVACSWTPLKNATETRQCQLAGRIDHEFCKFESDSPNKTCQLHGTGHRNCTLIFKTGELTVSDFIRLVVSCYIGEKWIGVEKETIMPFQNIKLNPPCDIKMENAGKPSYNLTWEVCSLSHYLEGSLEYEVRYKTDDSSEDTKILPILQDQKWIAIENLSPGKVYEASVRTKLQNSSSYKSIWSDWSVAATWNTTAIISKRATSSLIISHPAFLGSLIVIFLIISALLMKPWTLKRFRKMLKIHLPDTNKFFPSLTAIYGGNVQGWLSCPFSMASFHIASASPDVSMLEVLQKGNEEPLCFLFKKYLTHIETRDTCEHSSSSCFINHGYFCFQHFDALKVEPCKVYFSYDSFVDENKDDKDGDSYEVLQEIDNNNRHQPPYDTTGDQEGDYFLLETQEEIQKVGRCSRALVSAENLSTATAVEHDEKENKEEATLLSSRSPHKLAMGFSCVPLQSCPDAHETEAIRNVVGPHCSLVRDNKSSFYQPTVLNQGQTCDLLRTVSSSTVPNSEIYLSLKDLQSHYSHHSV